MVFGVGACALHVVDAFIGVCCDVDGKFKARLVDHVGPLLGDGARFGV